jgi:anaerobic dimethyl sulfoxide reductase subunit C (anchor subunit)
VLLNLVHGLLAWQISPESADHMTRLALLPVTPLALAGMLASFLHLGTPRNAWRALANLRTSWLSREILFAGLFAGLSGLFSAMQWFGWGPALLRSGLALLAALCGLGLVYCMARVYMLRSVLAWQTWLTASSFFATTFLLGGLALAAIYAGIVFNNLPLRDTGPFLHNYVQPWLSLAVVLLMGVQTLAAALWAANQTQPARHMALKAVYQRPAGLPLRLRTLLALRLGLGAAGVALFLLVYPAYGGWHTALLNALAFLLALAGSHWALSVL